MSTNYVKAKYQEIYDINTVSDKVSIIGIHTPTGAKPRALLAGHFLQYRKFKYSGCSVVATPAQRLGLNLAQLSTEAGASTVNPKDVFNPMLVRGCHGDNLNAALNTIYKGSFTHEGSSLGMDQESDSGVTPIGITWEQMYYRMLQDPSFKKFSMNSGLKLSGLHPMVYNVATDHQLTDVLSDSNNQPLQVGQTIAGTGIVGFNGNTAGAIGTTRGTIYPRFMTNRLQSLGWLDTRQVMNSGQAGYTALPKIFMACIILPMAKSDSVVTSMRFVVTHYFEFKEFNTSLTLEGASEYYDWLTTQSEKTASNDTFDVNSDQDNIEIVSDGVF